LGVEPYVARLKLVGISCGRPADDQPGLWGCGRRPDAGVESIGIGVFDAQGLVVQVHAYVAAPDRLDFDDYATTFFRETLMPTLVDEADRPPFETIREAARTSGKIRIGDLLFIFYESSTNRSVMVRYVGP
jgi:hypothetical protein